MPLDAVAHRRVATPDSRGDVRCGRVPGWGVIHTHPQAERWACANLNRAGYRTFLPLHTVKRRDPVLRTMTRLVEVPLFVSYAFVSLAPTDPWVPIRYTPGVHSLLMSGGKPNINATGSVDALHAVQALAATAEPKEAQWAPGDAVAPATGPFKGHEAVVIELRGLETALIAMLLFGELRQVSVDVNSLVARE